MTDYLSDNENWSYANDLRGLLEVIKKDRIENSESAITNNKN